MSDRQTTYWLVAFAMAAIGSYVAIELSMRLFLSAKTGIVIELHDFANKAAKKDMSPKVFGKSINQSPLLGWGQGEKREFGATVTGSKPFTIVVLGDSVTAGHGVQLGESYLDRLAAEPRFRRVRFINLAVRGYGIDQMWLKLEHEASQYHPDLIIFAFIPHDLLRPANDFLYSYSKPRLDVSSRGQANLELAVGTDRVYQDYVAARAGYRLTLWHMGRYWHNWEYYVPELGGKYFKAVYGFVADRLADYSENNKVPVLIVKLANSYSFRGQDGLIALAEAQFKARADRRDGSDMSYVDTQECSRAKAQANALNFGTEFDFHPGTAGHEILATCLEKPLAAYVAREEGKPVSGTR